MQQEQDYKMRRLSQTIFLLALVICFSAFIDNKAPAINRQDLTAPSMMPKKPSFALNKQEPLHPLLTEVLLPSKGGLIRGIDFGMTKLQIKSLEEACEEEAGDFRSKYSIACSIPEMSAFADVVYDFQPNGKMDMITIDYYLQDAYIAKAIFHDLMKYYTQQFGQKYYTDTDGYVIWETKRNTTDGTPQDLAVYLKKIGRGEDSGVSIQFVKK